MIFIFTLAACHDLRVRGTTLTDSFVFLENHADLLQVVQLIDTLQNVPIIPQRNRQELH